MTIADGMDQALATAKRAGWAPLIFKVHCALNALMKPSKTASRKGIPIDPTAQRSHLLCEGGRMIIIDADW